MTGGGGTYNIKFFYEQVSYFNKNYASLFGMDDEEEDEESERRDGEDTDDGSNTETTFVTEFSKRWGMDFKCRCSIQNHQY